MSRAYSGRPLVNQDRQLVKGELPFAEAASCHAVALSLCKGRTHVAPSVRDCSSAVDVVEDCQAEDDGQAQHDEDAQHHRPHLVIEETVLRSAHT